MQPNVENLGALQRRIDLSLASNDVEREVNNRLSDLARKVRIPGFRPGKVPLKMVAASYGAQVQAEVLNDQIGAAFNQAVSASGLRVAGAPRVEAREGAGEGQIGFRATFEVYPEIRVGDLSAAEVVRAACPVTDVEVDQTLEIMRRQRATFEVAGRPAQDGDRATVDYRGTLDGTAFEGGTAHGFVVTVGEGRMLPEFEQALRGMSTGETRSFELTFPADYRASELAGRTARFELTMHRLEAPQLPPLDESFARSLGVADGDLGRMRAEVRANLEREVSRRLRQRSRDSCMEALLASTSFEVPRTLVDDEARRLVEAARKELAARGQAAGESDLPPEAFHPQAERRVRLGLVLADVVRSNGLQARQEQVRRAIEEIAQSYEKPAEVIQWYLSQRERLAEIENQVIEDNVVAWVLGRARATEVLVAFDELMGRGA